MNKNASVFWKRALDPFHAVLYGGLTVATLDGLYAVIYSAFQGVGPVRVFQGVAAGLLGKSAAEGGVSTGVLGLMLHVLIATCIVATYYFVSKWVRILTERPVLSGIIYGSLVYITMYYIVIPLSAIGAANFLLESFIRNMIAHMVLIGLPAALFVRAAASSSAKSASVAQGEILSSLKTTRL
jgi:hypothetical protein